MMSPATLSRLRARGGRCIEVLAVGSAVRLAPLYAAVLLLSALLLFWLQPLFSKMVLPRYGGSPAVWTTAIMFFQVMLLAGYLYAHVVSRSLSLRGQVALHLGLLSAAFLMLPAHASNGPAAGASQVFSLLVLLTIAVGLPFFAVSATAPLLQKWFSRTSHPDAADPYFLYSASNVGSMAALIGYPLLFEPVFGLQQQSLLWSGLYALLTVLIVVCAASAWQYRAQAMPSSAATQFPDVPVPWTARMRWTLLAFAPSSLLLGVTQHITAEIAAVPLLWLIPLALYVLTFVIAFARRSVLKYESLARLQPLIAVLLALVWMLNTYAVVLVLHLVMFFVTAMMCHIALARSRPDVAHLTEFYLWLAAGGALGGVFNALVAPKIFDSILEYPLALCLACMLRPTLRSSDPQFRLTDLMPPVAMAGGFAVLIAAGLRPFEHGPWAIVGYLQVVGLALYLCHPRPIRFGLVLAVVLIASPVLHTVDEVLEKHRSFFGVHSVLKDQSNKFYVLMHGITIHGAQYIDPARRLETTAYFHRDSPIGQLFSAVGPTARLKRIAAVGMGLGTVACYREPGREWTFYEIDPLVVSIARDTRYFHFLTECAPQAKIVIGDGRLSLAQTPDAHYDLIIVDTFSSDAIPMHMITWEALALYLRKLNSHGIVIFHISNQYLDLVPVLATLAADAGATAMKPGPRLDLQLGDRLAELPSSWLAMARDASLLAALEAQEGWVRAQPDPKARLWTDDFSNVLGALKWKR